FHSGRTRARALHMILTGPLSRESSVRCSTFDVRHSTLDARRSPFTGAVEAEVLVSGRWNLLSLVACVRPWCKVLLHICAHRILCQTELCTCPVQQSCWNLLCFYTQRSSVICLCN
ncbi:unnamed protein product, partial [Mycena citricolor]